MVKLMKKLLKRSAYIVLCLFILVAWLLFTESGLKTSVFFVKPFLPGKLTIEKIEGSLFKTIAIHQGQYQDKDLILNFDTIKIQTAFIGFPKLLSVDFKNLKGNFKGQDFSGEGGLVWRKEKVREQEIVLAETSVIFGAHKFHIRPKDNYNPEAIQEKLNYSITGTLHSNINPVTFSGEVQIGPNSLAVNSLAISLKNKKMLTMNATVSLPDFSTLGFLKEEIKGNYSAVLNDFSQIYRLVPVVSRLKANIEAKGQISGNLLHPIVTLNAEINKAIFSIPKQRITVKQFTAKLSGTIPLFQKSASNQKDWSNQSKEFTLESQGTLHGNPFYIQGKFDPFKSGSPGKFELWGNDIRIFNTEHIRVVTRPHLKLNLSEGKLDITGKVHIVDADITLKQKMNNLVFSRDVVLVDSAQTLQQNSSKMNSFIKIHPHILLVIEDNVRFKGHGLDAEIRGQLDIEQRPDGVYTAEGRLTFNNGKYHLPNGVGTIDRGHLFYPKGTLLLDPVMDMRVIQKRKGNLSQGEDVGVYVQGTLQKPVYHLYSSQQMDQNTILSRLGCGGPEMEGKQNDRQWLSQTAALLGGGANPLVNSIQSKFGLEEFGIQTKDATKFVTTQEVTDTALVVGKSLGDRFYLQFLQGMIVPTSTLRLQYFLNPNIAASVETSTAGVGADLSFSVEK